MTSCRRIDSDVTSARGETEEPSGMHATTHSHRRPRLLVAVTDSISCLFLRGQLAASRQAGFDVALLCTSGELAVRIAEEERVLLLPVLMRRTPAPGPDLVALVRICLALRRFRPDLVNAGTPKAGLLVMLAAWFFRVPGRIYTLHGLRLETASGPHALVLQGIEWLTCALAHRVVCVSPSVRERALSLGVVSRHKAIVLGHGSCNGIDVVRFAPTPALSDEGRQVRSTCGIPQDALVVGFVGRLVRDKGILELTEAWSHLKKTFSTVNLLIVGWFDDGSIPASVCDLLRSDPRIHLVGPVADVVERYYAAMDVLVLPTYREGLPTVLLEACAMAIPVVATRVTGCVDVVDDGVTGTLVPSHDPSGLASAIAAYLSDGALRQRHGRGGRARVERCFGRHTVWDALHAEYARWVRVGTPLRSVAFRPN